MSSNTNSTGYSWGNTSQWSQLPTTQTAQSDTSSTPKSTDMPKNTAVQSMPMTSSPETRRDIISRLYKTILGREADSAGLNFFLFNSNLTENDIAKEMYESTEHQEILSKAKDVRSMIGKLQENSKKIRDLEIKLQSSEELCKNYKSLLDQKKQMIDQLTSSHPEYPTSQSLENSNYQTSNQSSQTQNNDGIYLNDPFAEDYGKKGKGCFGTIKNLFKRS